MGHRWTQSFLWITLAGCWLGLAGPAAAVYPPAIKDEGKFFSKDALDKANKKIRQIYEKYKKDVVIETVGALSADQEKKLKDEGTKYFPKLARERSLELGLNGIYIYFSKKPQHYQIHMDPDTQKSMFKTSNRTEVSKKIIARFKEDEFDQGLLDALDTIDAGLKANSATKGLPASR